MFDPRNNLSNEVSAQLIEHFGDKVFRTIIPRNVRLAEAPSFGKPALFHDKESRGALAYLALAGEMIRRDEPPLPPTPHASRARIMGFEHVRQKAVSRSRPRRLSPLLAQRLAAGRRRPSRPGDARRRPFGESAARSAAAGQVPAARRHARPRP
jgi:hypothetical protein